MLQKIPKLVEINARRPSAAKVAAKTEPTMTDGASTTQSRPPLCERKRPVSAPNSSSSGSAGLTASAIAPLR